MDNKDIMAESEERAIQNATLSLQRLLQSAIEGAEVGIQGLIDIVQDTDQSSGDRIDAMKSLITRIIPERVPTEGAGVPDLDIEKLTAIFAKNIESQV